MKVKELELIRDALLYLWLSMDKENCYYGVIEDKIKGLTKIIKDKNVIKESE